MKSTISSRSGVQQDASRPEATRSNDLSDKGQIPHFSSPAEVERLVAPRATWRVLPASAGDHPMIHQFLVSVFHKPSPAEFQAQLEEPSYEPSHRLLIENGNQIVAHLRLLHREMRFGKLVLPAGIVTDVATLPEYRRHGCRTALLAAARKTLLRDGAVLGLLATDQPRFYLRRGWIVNGRHCYGTLGPREILSHLQVRETELRGLREDVLRPPSRKRYNIRLWRHVELAALTRLYDENTFRGYGSLVRTDAYWRWLVGRGGNKQVYVAINGRDKFELDESLSPIVGYAAAREGRIVELMCSADTEASIQLLAVCLWGCHRERLFSRPA